MNIPDHSHCEICGVPVARGERFCGSAECEEKHQEAIRTKKRSMAIFVALIVITLILVNVRF